MSNKLDDVLAAKREHVRERRRAMPFSQVERHAANAGPVRGFTRALQDRIGQGRYALIAEVKKASPSKGLIRADFDPAQLAKAYAAGGACCLSVLTDTPFFQGSDEDLIAARGAVTLPVLRKDFLVDPYQVAESRMLGADCILLIMAAVSDLLGKEIIESATAYGMDVLVEIHDDKELDRALALGPALVGINNRNLKTLQVDLSTSVTLAPRVPAGILTVGESGLSCPADLAILAEAGTSTFLIGESMLRNDDVMAAAKALLVDRP